MENAKEADGIKITGKNKPSNDVVFGCVFEDTEKIERVEKMDIYLEKMQLRYHTPEEAEAIMKKKAEKMAKKMLLSNEPIKKIIEYTELTEKRVLAIKKRLKT